MLLGLVLIIKHGEQFSIGQCIRMNLDKKKYNETHNCNNNVFCDNSEKYPNALH